MKAIEKDVYGTFEELLRMYPEFYSKITDMCYVVNAEANMVDDVIDTAQTILDDSNITTAREAIISFYESIINVREANRSVEERRNLILLLFNMMGKLSASKIINVIKIYTGQDVEILFNRKDEKNNYILEILTQKDNIDSAFLSDMQFIMNRILPAHLVKKHQILNRYTIKVGVKLKQLLTNYIPCGTVKCGVYPTSTTLGVSRKSSLKIETNKNVILNNYDYCGNIPNKVKLGMIITSNSNMSYESRFNIGAYKYCGTVVCRKEED